MHFPYRRVHPYDVWDDDPSSPLYNAWVDDRYADPGTDPEPMGVSAYDYGAVIGYNRARTPGLGSAIFLHINIGMPTAGCVTLPALRAAGDPALAEPGRITADRDGRPDARDGDGRDLEITSPCGVAHDLIAGQHPTGR